MGNEKKEHHAAAPMVAGILGGSVSTVSLFPLDLIKVRFQANEDPGYRTKGFRRRTMLRTMGQVIRHEGVVGLYQGLAPALIGSAASWGGYFFLYEGIKKELLHLKHKASPHDETEHKLGASENFGAACSAGAVMVLLTNPVWLIKTRMQLQMKNVMKEREREGLSMKRPYNNMWDAAKTIVREEGPLALYKGAIPALMLVSHGGIQFVAYEFLKNHFGTYTREARTQADNDGSKRNNVIERLEDSIGYLTMGAVSKV
jgi:solute carrier family 25 folate transporter 32